MSALLKKKKPSQLVNVRENERVSVRSVSAVRLQERPDSETLKRVARLGSPADLWQTASVFPPPLKRVNVLAHLIFAPARFRLLATVM